MAAVDRSRVVGSTGFLAAYNGGPARYEEHLAGCLLPAETQAYLQKLLPVIVSDIAASGAVANFVVIRGSSSLCGLKAQRPQSGCSLGAR